MEKEREGGGGEGEGEEYLDCFFLGMKRFWRRKRRRRRRRKMFKDYFLFCLRMKKGDFGEGIEKFERK